jgi:hypothetical protein
MADDVSAKRSVALGNLTRVGPAKPIGYLPLYTIRHILLMDPHVLARNGVSRGLSAAVYQADECCIKSGALYLYHRSSLEQLLQSVRSVLVANSWPIDPDQFVARIAREWIDSSHPSKPVIERAFGDWGV